MRFIIRDRVSDGAAQHGESVVFGVVDLQDPEGFSDIVADEFLVGGHLGLLDAGRVQLLTRRGNDWTHKYRAIAEDYGRRITASATPTMR